jgi:hypothetical protein
MDNKEFTRLLSDTKENLNQLNKIVKDNIVAQEHIFDNSFDSLLKQNDGEKKTVENKSLQEVYPTFDPS